MQAAAYIDAVLAKCDSLQDARFWPPEPLLRPRAWLHNFAAPENLVAAVLLDQFVYYSDHLTDHVLCAAMSRLVQTFGGRDASIAEAQADFDHFLSRAAFTPIEGEVPNPTDSGPLICRKIRSLFRIPETHIISPSAAVDHALAGGSIILVDDFIGSGEQVTKHWRRQYDTAARRVSLADAFSRRPFPAFYVCLAATSGGLRRLALAATPLHVCAAHELGPSYDIRNLSNRNIISWFPHIKAEIPAFLSTWAPKLALRPYMRQDDFAEYGFHSFGLTIGFEHSPCPDATLPLFWAGTDDPMHIPLVPRPQ